jgi:hypothetical protein
MSTLIAIAPWALGCSAQPDPSHSSSPNSATPGLPNDSNDLNPFSPNNVYPKGWNKVIITANSAKTTVSSAAHFTTTRNACGRDAYGAIDSESWNNLSKSLNVAVTTTLLPEETQPCVDTPDYYPYMDGTVEVELNQANEKKTIYALKNGQICTSIPDPETSKVLLEAIHNIIKTADKEECPNGWGS